MSIMELSRQPAGTEASLECKLQVAVEGPTTDTLVLVDVSGQVECRNVSKHLARLYMLDPRLFHYVWVTVHYKTPMFGTYLNFVDHSIPDRQLSTEERKAKATVYSDQEYEAYIDTVEMDESCHWEPCYNCTSLKHVTDDCEEPMKDILKYCDVCTLNGHTIDDCPYAFPPSGVRSP